MVGKYKFRVICCSDTRKSHEDKKRWLNTQGIHFGEYDLKNLPKSYKGVTYWGGLNFYWCFEREEIATAFRLRWKENDE